MATPPRRVSWDACAWIATIIQEQALLKGGGIEDRARLCNHTIDLARRKRLEIVTSGLSLAEVCRKSEVKARDDLADFFRHDFIFVVPVDRFVGGLARDLQQTKLAKLKPADAVHLATAIYVDVAEFHTFDEALLKLNDKVPRKTAGTMRICKPPPPPPSLFDPFPGTLQLGGG